MTFRKAEAPYAIQLEAAEGCNLRCTFCGLNGIRGKENDYKFMTFETITQIALDIRNAGWNSRIEFAMHGEPTMHPDLAGLFRVLRTYLPKNQIMLTTNGGGLLRGGDIVGNVQRLFDAGLTVLGLDDYQHAKIVPKIRAHRETLEKIAPCYEYPEEADASLHKNDGKRRIVFVQAIDFAVSGNHSKLSNHAGAAAPKDFSMKDKRCAKPFRELSVRWDGSIALCCEDWRGEYVIRAPEEKMSLSKAWQSDAFNAARQKLLHHERDFGVCNGCTSKSYRTGLLPDKFGKETLAVPDEGTAATIAAALARGPLTAPVLRPWEVKGENLHTEQGASGEGGDHEGVQSGAAG